MASVYDKYYGQQPGAVKAMIVGGVLVTGYIIYRNIQKNKEKQDALKAASAADAELNALASHGVTPSYSDSQFLSYVNVLVQAMTGCGTDEDAVYGVFRQMKNEADIRKLIVSFGIQYYQPCEVTSPAQYLYWQFNDQAYGGDLGTWLGYDLSDSEISTVNSILRNNGINFSF